MNRSMIDEFARGIGLLYYATEGLTPLELRSRSGPGEWSIAQVVLHMMDSDLVGADRMKRVIAEDTPTLLAYDETKWAASLFYEEQPVATAAVLFDLNRRHVADVLRRLDDATFERAGIHTERGRETLEQLVCDYAAHLDHHLKFIYEKRQRLGRPIAPRYSRGET